MSQNKKPRKIPAFLLKKKKVEKYTIKQPSKLSNRYSAKRNFEMVIIKAKEQYQTLLALKSAIKELDKQKQTEHKTLMLHLKQIHTLDPQYVYTLNKIYNEFEQGKRAQRTMTRLQCVWCGVMYKGYTQFEAVDKYIYKINERITNLSLLWDRTKRESKQLEYGKYYGEMKEL